MPANPSTQPRKMSEIKNLSDLERIAISTDSRLQQLEEDYDKVEKALWGQNGNVGMVGRLKGVEDVIADIKKLLWAILAVVLGIAIGGVWQAISHVIASGG